MGEVGSVDKFKISGGNWGLEIWLYLMTPCWQNKHGDYKKNTKLSFLQGFQGKIFPQLLNHGGEGFKIGSYAWRSILQGRDVLLRGSRWRIENEKFVKIWHHWLPRKNPPLL